jgi:hypothetical protein
MKMKDSKALLLEYLASIRDPERAASLFADDGVFELPFLRSLGVGPRYAGRREITRSFTGCSSSIRTSLSRRTISISSSRRRKRRSPSMWRTHAPLRPGERSIICSLVAEAGEIKLLRETFNPLAMAQAQLPNGVADIGPPGDQVHSF